MTSIRISDGYFNYLTKKMGNFPVFMPGNPDSPMRSRNPEIVESVGEIIREIRLNRFTYGDLVQELSTIHKELEPDTDKSDLAREIAKDLYCRAFPVFLELRRKGRSIVSLSGYENMPCEFARSIKAKDRMSA